MFEGSFKPLEAISPDELTMLHGTLKEWCSENRIELQSIDAEDTARVLINAFRHGKTTPELLLASVARR